MPAHAGRFTHHFEGPQPAPTVKPRGERRTRRAPGLFAYLWYGSRSSLLAAPVLYSLIVPLVLLDSWMTLYQWVCFPLFGIARVERRRHIVFDRQRLPYLNGLEKVNCTFCSYANGVLAYVTEIAARSEEYWCPIKHQQPLESPHRRYHRFFEYGDAEGYRRGIVDARR